MKRIITIALCCASIGTGTAIAGYSAGTVIHSGDHTTRVVADVQRQGRTELTYFHRGRKVRWCWIPNYQSHHRLYCVLRHHRVQ